MPGNYKLKQEIWSDSIPKKDKLKKEKFKSKDLKNLLMITKKKKVFFCRMKKAIMLCHPDSSKINKNR